MSTTLRDEVSSLHRNIIRTVTQNINSLKCYTFFLKKDTRAKQGKNT